MRRVLLLACAVCLATFSARAQDPVKVAPKHYKVEFENEQVRVLRVHLGPKESMPMHEHPPAVLTFLTDGGTWAMAIARAMVRRAADGDTRAAAEICDRVEGRPRAEFSVEGYGEVLTLDSFRGMSDEELNQRLEKCNQVLKETTGRPQLPKVPQ
jgi:hypothetical protein